MTDTDLRKAFLHSFAQADWKRVRTPTYWGLAVEALINLCSGRDE